MTGGDERYQLTAQPNDLVRLGGDRYAIVDVWAPDGLMVSMFVPEREGDYIIERCRVAHDQVEQLADLPVEHPVRCALEDERSERLEARNAVLEARVRIGDSTGSNQSRDIV
jgi:hypothetical protein